MSLEEGRIIRQARKRSGFTQIDLADKIGISFQPINRIENGFESVSLHNLRLICEAIGLEVIIQNKNA